MHKKIIIFALVAITLVWAAPAFTQTHDDALYWNQRAWEQDQEKRQFRENRKALIDKDGNPINGYDDKRTKEDEARETLEFLKKVGNQIKSCFDAGVEWFEKACKPQQAQQKGTNSRCHAQKRNGGRNSNKRTRRKKK